MGKLVVCWDEPRRDKITKKQKGMGNPSNCCEYPKAILRMAAILTIESEKAFSHCPGTMTL
jgi:hypothetical protein